MDFETLILERGEDLQYALFFAGLAVCLGLEVLLPRRTTPRERRLRWPTNFGMTTTNVLALGFVPFSFVGAALWVDGIDVDADGWTQTGSTGEFEIDGLEPGRYRVNIRDWQTGLAHNETVEVATSKEIEIEVPTAEITGRIFDSTDLDIGDDLKLETIRWRDCQDSTRCESESWQ